MIFSHDPLFLGSLVRRCMSVCCLASHMASLPIHQSVLIAGHDVSWIFMIKMLDNTPGSVQDRPNARCTISQSAPQLFGISCVARHQRPFAILVARIDNPYKALCGIIITSLKRSFAECRICCLHNTAMRSEREWHNLGKAVNPGF